MTLVAEASTAAKRFSSFAHTARITLMDLQMPEMNGLDAMAAILGNFRRANHRAHNLLRRRAGAARYQGGRPRLPFKK